MANRCLTEGPLEALQRKTCLFSCPTLIQRTSSTLCSHNIQLLSQSRRSRRLLFRITPFTLWLDPQTRTNKPYMAREALDPWIWLKLLLIKGLLSINTRTIQSWVQPKISLIRTTQRGLALSSIATQIRKRSSQWHWALGIILSPKIPLSPTKSLSTSAQVSVQLRPIQMTFWTLLDSPQ